jgi:hypothetical protein
MAPMRQLRNLLVNRSVGLPFFLLLCLLFFIQTTSTVVGRAYYHLVGLHADTLTNGTKSLLLVTLIVPFLILIATKPFRTRIPSSYFVIHVGLWLWFAGATISTLSHGRNPIVVLNYVAGVGSALAVFNAARRVPLTSVLHIEAVFAAVALGGLLPTLQSLVLYCQTWSFGRPSVAALYQARFEAYKWSVLGNRGNASVFFGLLASTCLAIVFLNVFSRTTRWLAAVVLVCSGALMVLCMSRTGIVVFALSGLTVIVFSRDAKAWCFSATLAILLILALPGTPVSTVPNYFLRALRYDVASMLRPRRALSRFEKAGCGSLTIHLLEWERVKVGLLSRKAPLINSRYRKLPNTVCWASWAFLSLPEHVSSVCAGCSKPGPPRVGKFV